MVPRNVATLTNPPTLEAYEAKPVPAASLSRLLVAAAGDRLEALWTVTVWLGLRQGEVFGLRWADVDLDGRTLSIRNLLQWSGTPPAAHLVPTKTSASKGVLPLPGPVVQALRRHNRHQRSPAASR